MKGICVQELDVLVPCSLVSRDDDETRGKVGIVSHQLAWRAPSRVNLQYLHGCGVKEVEFILEKKEEDREEETEEVIKEEGEGSKRFLRNLKSLAGSTMNFSIIVSCRRESTVAA